MSNRRTAETYKMVFEREIKKRENKKLTGKHEQVKQCHEPYPPFWFVTDQGKLFSVKYSRLKQLKPLHSWKNKDKTHKWYFDYYIDGKKKKVEQQRLVAEHFLTKPQTDEKIEIHHKKKIDSFSTDEPYNANNKDNIQYVTKSEHDILTRISRTPLKKQDNEFIKSLFAEPNKINVIVDTNWIMTNAELTKLVGSKAERAFVQTLTDDMKEKQVEVLRADPESDSEK